jgi:hypothetical protein
MSYSFMILKYLDINIDTCSIILNQLRTANIKHLLLQSNNYCDFGQLYLMSFFGVSLSEAKNIDEVGVQKFDFANLDRRAKLCIISK